MSQKVQITIKGLQGDLIESEAIEMVTTGDLYMKNDHIYIHYIDKQLDTEKETKTSVKIEEHRVTIARFGAANSQMIFEKGFKHVTAYATPFGVFDVCTHTRGVSVERNEGEIKVAVSYFLELDQKPIGESFFSIETKAI